LSGLTFGPDDDESNPADDGLDDLPPREPEFDMDLAHPEPLPICPAQRINARCFCPNVRAVQVFSSAARRLVPVLLCTCCGGLPA
jgi:hypothetical protein